MRIRKILNILLVLVNIFLVVSLILSLVFNTESFKSLYWIAVFSFIAVSCLDIGEWSKIGLDVETEKSKMIKRTFDDNTALLVVFYVLLFLVLLFFDQLDNRVFLHNYVIIGFFIMTVVFEVFTYISINNAKKDTANLLKEKK